jgi:hypothetical protein
METTKQKLCRNCKHYDYSNYSDWAHDIVFHTCRHPKAPKGKKYNSDNCFEINKNNDCTLFEAGEPINSPYYKKEIEKQEGVMRRRASANIFMATSKFVNPDKFKKKGFLKRMFKSIFG